MHVFLKPFFSSLTEYSLTGSFTPLSSGITALRCEVEEDRSIIQLIISMSIFSRALAMWVNRSWTQTEIPWHLWISITLGLQRMNLFLNMAIPGRSTVLLTRSKCHAAILPPLWLLRWHREHIKKNERCTHLYNLSCVLCMNFRANTTYRQYTLGVDVLYNYIFSNTIGQMSM